jgi:AcrR family transcriptional regulator
MQARAAAAEATREQILEAARALHAEQGILGTSYDAIARRAGHAQATVYRHFPSLDDLLPACARSVHVLQPLSRERAEATFQGMAEPSLRIEVLVRGTCDCYERDAGWLQAARREEDLLPVLQDLARIQREGLLLLTRTALAGTDVSDRTVRMVAALLDFPVWKALRDAGFTAAEAAEEIRHLVEVPLIREGIL